MKILVTSGGTKIPIDMVRDITNMSKGTFGSKIATELLKMQQQVIFLTSKDGKTPFKAEIDLTKPINLSCLSSYPIQFINNYIEFQYRNFDDYKSTLEKILINEKPDIVVLAAAVSDYGVNNHVLGKIRSNNDMKIELFPLPKIINSIKKIHPNCKLIGFKLLVGSDENALIESAQKSIVENNCDMVVANDLKDIKQNNHRVHLIFPNNECVTYSTDPNDSNFLARKVAQHTLKL